MTLLEQYEQQAVLLGADLTDDPRLPLRTRDYLRRAKTSRIKGAFGPFRQMVDGSVVPDADQAQIAGTTEAALFPAASYTGLAGQQLRSGQVWDLSCHGVITTAGASPGNITVTPRLGTTSGGTSLGASAATALATSGTNLRWWLQARLTMRAIGLPGANSHIMFGGYISFEPGVLSTNAPVLFGLTAVATVDISVATGIYIGITLGSACDTMKCLGHPCLQSLN